MAEGWSDYRPMPFWDNILIGLLTAFCLLTFWSLGYYSGQQNPKRTESVMTGDSLPSLNLPLLPVQPDRHPGQRTRF